MSLYPPSVTIPVYATFTAVGVALTGLRFWVRLGFTRGSTGADDWLMAVGMAIVCACAGIQFYNALEGTGGEAISEDEAASRAITSHIVNFTMIAIEKPAFGAIKLSLLFFYRRIFSVWPSFNRLNNALIVLVMLWWVSFMTADLLICGTEIELNWALDQSLAADHCGDKGLLLLMFAVTSVVTDFLVMGLPFLYIRRLQMPPQKKWAAALVVFLGCISTFAGILRTSFLSVAYPMGRMDWDYVAPPQEETPMVLQVFNPTFWVMIEMLLMSWAANLPPLGPLLRTVSITKVVKSIGYSYGSRYGSARSKGDTWQSSMDRRRSSAAPHPDATGPGTAYSPKVPLRDGSTDELV